MKKIFISLCVVGCVGASAISCPLDYFKKLKEIKCPESLVKEGTAEEIKKSKDYLIELDKLGDAKTIYIDTLNSLHQDEDISRFVNEKSFKEFSETNLFTNLLKAKTLKDKEKYETLLSKVDTNNPYWCSIVENGNYDE